MKLFVTGATGFIGSHFIERALADGHRVCGLYRSEIPQRRRQLAQLRAAGVELHRADLLDFPALGEAFTNADVVCHFAGAFTEAGRDEAFYHRTNVLGTANLVALAAARGVKRFVHCSTAGIYGRCSDGVIDETATPAPWNPYESSKLASEGVVREIAGARAMQYVILRPAVVYGPRDERMRKMFSLVSRARFPLFGAGAGRRHLVHVADVADAFMQACTAPSAANQEMIIAGPEAVPLRDLLRLLADVARVRRHGPRLPLAPMLAAAGLVEDVCRALGVQPPLHRRRMDFYLNDAAFDCVRARQILGWEPKIGLRDGLTRTLASYQQPDVAGLDWTHAVRARAPSSHR